jgi:hypothetical protein
VKAHHKINIGIKGNVSIATFDLCTKKRAAWTYIIWAGIVRSLLAAQKTHPSSAPIKGR